ncbi:MAG: biotin/lipoyl-containing protein [Bacteroidales bacterium]
MKDYKFTINGNIYKVTIDSIDENIANVEVNGTPYKVEMDRPSKKQIRPLTQPQKAPVTSTGDPVVSRPASSGQPGAVRSPLPGIILSVEVKVGDNVKRGQKIAILEAMKMENNILADRDGVVSEIKVNKGDNVLEGADLVIIG